MISLHNPIGLLMLLTIVSFAVSFFDDSEEWPLWVPFAVAILWFGICESMYWGAMYFFIWN